MASPAAALQCSSEDSMWRNTSDLAARMALWAGIGGPVQVLTKISVWIPSFHASTKPWWR
uniref:Uncharacterized protein n=1 Tax=Arundo donax TaxID=35708 RepID=A0A0A9ESH2_ARUDO